MSPLFAVAEQVLCTPDVEAKLTLTRETWCAFQAGRFTVAGERPLGPMAHGLFPGTSWSLSLIRPFGPPSPRGRRVQGAAFSRRFLCREPLPIAAARFPARPERVDPRDLPKRRLNSTEGRVALLHAVAHIEFTAIQLAWDHLYRFRGLPDEYYRDWLGVAEEEARHFQLLRARLLELGADYGDLPAHGGLWGIAVETAYDVAARMALVPRFMEARGLDVTPGMIARLRELGDSGSVAALEQILRDEVGHVALGSRWFHWICEQRGIEPEETYFVLVSRHMKGQARGPFNTQLRLQAGFSSAELERLAQGH